MAINIQEIQAKLANRPRSSSSGEKTEFKWYKLPKEGEAKIIFLPPTHEETVPGLVQWTHWNIPEVNHLTCLRTFEKTCPYCEALKNIQNKVSDDILKQYQSTGRAVHNVLVIGDKSIPANEPQIMTSGEYTYWWLLEQILNQEVGDITDPHAAHSVTFKRTTPGGRFERIISLRPIPIAETEEAIQAILAKAANLHNIWKYSQELEDKLKTAADVAVQDLLNKTSIMMDPSPHNIPTPSALKPQAAPQPVQQAPVMPSEASFPSAPTPQPQVAPQPAPVAQPQAAVSSQPILNVNPSNPLNKPECFGQYPPEGDKRDSVCSLCPMEIECETASKTV